MLAILVGGWIVAKVIQTVLVRLLEAVRADSLAERIRFAEMLARGGIQRTFPQLLGAMAYWLVMLVVRVAALNALQLTATAELSGLADRLAQWRWRRAPAPITGAHRSGRSPARNSGIDFFSAAIRPPSSPMPDGPR